LLLVEAQAELADAIGESMNTMLEVRRYAKKLAETRQELKNMPVRELGWDWFRARTAEFRQTANGPGSPTAIVHDAIALLTDAPTRRLSAIRSWAEMYAVPAGDDLRALDACPVTGAPCFGAAFMRVLTDKALFDQTRVITVVGDRGVALIEFTDGRDARFRAGMPLGPAFRPGRGIQRLRSIEVPKLRRLFNLLAAETRP